MLFLGFGDFLFEQFDLAANEIAIFERGGGQFMLETFNPGFVSRDAGLEGVLETTDFFFDDEGPLCCLVLRGNHLLAIGKETLNETGLDPGKQV